MVSTINTDENLSEDIIDQDIIKEAEETSNKGLNRIDYKQNTDKVISQIKPSLNISDKKDYTNDLMIEEIGGDPSKSLITIGEFDEDEKQNFDTPSN